jgi:hypothetical protein
MSAPNALVKPVVFIHGLQIHSTAWRPCQQLFAEAGCEPHVPGWTGDAATPAATRDRPEAVTGLGVAELTAGSLGAPRVAYGPFFGAGVWGTSYVVLPAAGLYKPIWEYDRVTLAKDRSAHLLYGTTTAATFAVLAPRKR